MTSIWDIIRIPFGYLLSFLYEFTGNYGISLILFAVIVKLILLPLSIKSKKSSMKMARLSPELKLLEKKYGDDKVKYQQAMQQLYKDEGISMTGGCLWSLIPLIILIPLYQVIREPMIYMMHLSADTSAAVVEKLLEMGVDLGRSTYYRPMVAASLLPQYLDELRAAIPALQSANIPLINYAFLGVNLSSIPTWRFWTLSGWSTIGLFIIPVISGAFNWLSMWASQKLNGSVSTNEKGEKSDAETAAMGSMKGMMLMMPLFSIYIGFTMPAGMSIYWTAQAVLGLLQELVLTKHYRKVYDAEDVIKRQRAAEQAAIEAEKERIRAERRAKNPDGIIENTSKKKIKARERAERAVTVEGKLTPEEREALRQQRAAASPTGDPNRPHGKGRAYVANRYGKDGEELVSESGEPVVIDDYEELSEEELPAVEESAVTEAPAKPDAPAAEEVPSSAPEAEEAAADPAEDLLDDADASDSLFGASSDDTDDNT